MWEQIRYNQIRTVIFIIGIGLLLVLLGYLIGLLFSISLNLMFLFTGQVGRWGPGEFGITGIIVALIVWMVVSLVAYFRGDNILLARAKAKKIEAEDLRRVYNVVEELKISSGLEVTPSIYVIDDTALTAFSIGRDPKKSAVIITYGLLTKLNRDELQGVIGHEIAHIKNRDVLLMTMCSVLLGTMIILSYYPYYLSWGKTTITEQEPSKTKYSDRTNLRTAFISIFVGWIAILALPFENSISLALLIVFACLSLILTPLTIGVLIGLPFTVLLIYYAISRRREYLADALSVVYTRYPEGLASALEKIAASTDQLQSATPALAPIYIANPFGRHDMATSELTSTHPSISERIRILRAMAHISYYDYDRAYREVTGTGKSMIPAHALASAEAEPIRAAVPDDLDDIQRAREASNALWNADNYKNITCACGTRMRLPPSFKLPEVKCPHCGRINPV
jgi:heat shock protein HtpX